MRFAVFADIHGNIYALRAMLQQVKEYDVDGFIFCGDIMGYFLGQEEVIECISQMKNIYAVMGNHDFYYTNTLNVAQRSLYAEKYGKSYLNEITLEQKSYLQKLPQSIELYCMGRKVFIVHGSLENVLEGRIYPDTKIDEKSYCKYDIVILGHTHYQMFRKYGKTVLINPGSLGQPRDFKGNSYCIINMETLECTFKKIHINQRVLIDELIINNEKEQLVRYIQSKMEVIT